MLAKDSLKAAHRVLNNRWVALAVAIVLIVTSIFEIIESGNEIGSHHGVLIFGIFHMLNTLPDFYEAAFAIDELE
jgi:hypothetical protein